MTTTTTNATTKFQGEWIKDEDIELRFGSIQIKHYQNILEIDSGESYISERFLHPRLYNPDLTNDLKSWLLNDKYDLYRNYETKEFLNVKKDVNKTPKRKVKMNIVWEVNPKAHQIAVNEGFVKVCN